MVKFIVAGYRYSELTEEQFRRDFRDIQGPLASAIPACGAMFRTSYNQTSGGTRRGTSWWNSGSTIDEQWKQPGSHQRDAERLTT
jgi:hypothetical protein